MSRVTKLQKAHRAERDAGDRRWLRGHLRSRATRAHHRCSGLPLRVLHDVFRCPYRSRRARRAAGREVRRQRRLLGAFAVTRPAGSDEARGVAGYVEKYRPRPW